ncbi:MAG: hypothetical protein E6J91_00160 [Deltaproteobacteria bacterium]|nr:MAG: hypothetical protein E6J91_00160 [Deltaproteobacteria bacterium]
MSAVARRYYERGRHALEVNDLESAQEALRAALDLAPTFGNARVAYAVALARANDCPRAATVLRAGFGAEEAFQTAAQTPGFEVRAASGLARVYARLGRYRDMAAQLKRAARPAAG